MVDLQWDSGATWICWNEAGSWKLPLSVSDGEQSGGTPPGDRSVFDAACERHQVGFSATGVPETLWIA